MIKKPLVTEKNTMHAAANTYGFEVSRSATKLQIKRAIEKAFDVHVQDVRTMICRDRARRTGMNLSKVRYWKKALVRIAEGEKIHLFEGA